MEGLTEKLLNTAYNGYKALKGPSYLDCLPNEEHWLEFKKLIQSSKGLAMIELWHEKAVAAKGVPLRKEFSFKDLAEHGSHMMLYKLTEDNRWLTTFCGDTIVAALGVELTGKYIDEYGDENALEFWMENIKYISEHGAPLVEYYSLNFVDKEFIQCMDINLPLRSGERDFPDMFLAMMIFDPTTSNKSFVGFGS